MGKMLHKRKIKYMMGISHGSCTGALDGKQLQLESEQWRAVRRNAGNGSEQLTGVGRKAWWIWTPQMLGGQHLILDCHQKNILSTAERKKVSFHLRRNSFLPWLCKGHASPEEGIHYFQLQSSTFPTQAPFHTQTHSDQLQSSGAHTCS